MDRKARDILDLLEREGPQLHALFVRLTLRQDVAEELLQELFIKLYQSHGFMEADNPTAYAFRSAVHLGFDWRRSRRRKPAPASLAMEPAAPGQELLTDLMQAEQIEKVLEAVSRLPDIYRQVLVMRRIQEQPYEVIGSHLGKTADHVRSLCHKALTQLRTLLGADRAGPAKKDVEDV